MLLLAGLRGVPFQCGQSNFVAKRNKAFRREDFCNSTTAQPLMGVPSRMQEFAAGLVHTQRSHQRSQKLHANSDQTGYSVPRGALTSLRPEVLQVLPEAIDLDMRLHGEMLERGVLDTSTLSSADNPLCSLWLSTEGLTKRYLAGQVARKHEPSLMHNPVNELVLRLRAFCIKLKEKYLDNSRPAPLDFYVLASSSVKVGNHTYSALIVTFTVKPGVLLQLIWKSSADESVKAYVSGRILVDMCQSAAEICKVNARCSNVDMLYSSQ